MRKAIVALVAVLCLAGVSAALPTLAGGGGTIYVDQTVGGNSQVISYLDFDSNWGISNSGTLTTISDSAVTTAAGGGGYGAISAFNTTDMGGVYHSGTVLISASNKLITLSGTTGTQTVVNGNPTIDSSDSLAAFATKKFVATDGGFTNGTASGIAVAGDNNGNLERSWQSWSGSGSTYTTGTGAAMYWNNESSNYENSPLVYAACNTTMSGVTGTVTGMIAYTNADARYYPQLYVVFKTAAGFTRTTYNLGTVPGGQNVSGTDAAAVELANGTPEIFYTTDGGVIDSAVLNANGSVTNLTSAAGAGVMTVITATDGSEDLLVYSGHWNGVAVVGSLDMYTINLTTGALGADTSIATGLSNASNVSGITVEALGNSTVQGPEPATLMLVGTGVLGLAGVIRRRLVA